MDKEWDEASIDARRDARIERRAVRRVDRLLKGWKEAPEDG